MKFYIFHHNYVTHFATLLGGGVSKIIAIKNEALNPIYFTVWMVAKFDIDVIAELA